MPIGVLLLGGHRSAPSRSTFYERIPVATSYKTDIKLGERYRDEQTGFTGVATSVTFYQHACERVCVEDYDPVRKEIKEAIFDSPRLTSIRTEKTATSSRPGGPGAVNAQPGIGAR